MMNKNRQFMIKSLFSSMVRRRSRIFVALLGIIIGATVLSGMVTLCYDIPRQMGQEFRAYGANIIFTPKSNGTRMKLSDIYQATARLPADKLIGVSPFRYETIRSGMHSYTLVGIDFSQISQTSPYWQIDGLFPTRDDEIVVGTDIANFTRYALGDVIPILGKSPIGDKFEQEFKISGIVKTGKAEDNFIFIPLTVLDRLFGEGEQVDIVEISINANEAELQAYIALLTDPLTNPLTTIEPHLIKWVTQSENTVLNKLSSLLYLVTSVVLMLTLICVATTMMTVVIERRKEIGLKKALGAKNGSIAAEFLIEGMILGFIGGAIGSICGLIFAQIISSQVFARAISIELYLIPITITVSIVVTVIACLIPVKRAVEVEPALVLRGE